MSSKTIPIKARHFNFSSLLQSQQRPPTTRPSKIRTLPSKDNEIECSVLPDPFITITNTANNKTEKIHASELKSKQKMAIYSPVSSPNENRKCLALLELEPLCFKIKRPVNEISTNRFVLVPFDDAYIEFANGEKLFVKKGFKYRVQDGDKLCRDRRINKSERKPGIQNSADYQNVKLEFNVMYFTNDVKLSKHEILAEVYPWLHSTEMMTLGRGSFGTVNLHFSKIVNKTLQDTSSSNEVFNDSFAVKRINAEKAVKELRKRNDPQMLGEIQSEMKILKKLLNPRKNGKEILRCAHLNGPISIYPAESKIEKEVLILSQPAVCTIMQEFRNDNSTCNDSKKAQSVIHQILTGIRFLHLQHPPIAHRDLKPNNVLINHYVDKIPIIQICDFGHACFVDDGTIESIYVRDVKGTPGYIAPELRRLQCQGLEETIELNDSQCNTNWEYDEKVDIYSIGCIAFYLISGKHALTDSNCDGDSYENLNANAISDHESEDFEAMQIGVRGWCDAEKQPTHDPDFSKFPPIRVFTDYHGNQELWLNFPDQMGWNSVGNGVHEFIKQCLQVKSKDRPSAAKLISVSEYLNGSDSSEIKKIEIKGGENLENQYKALYDTYRSGKVDQMTQSINVISKEEESEFSELQKVVFGGKSARELQDDSEGNASKRIRLDEPVASIQEIDVSQKITDISLDEDRFPDVPADIGDSVKTMSKNMSKTVSKT